MKNKDIKLPDGIKYWFLDLVLLKIEPVKIMPDWKGGKKARGQSKYCASGFRVFLVLFLPSGPVTGDSYMERSREGQGNQFPYAEDASRRWLESARGTNRRLRAFLLHVKQDEMR